LSGIQIARLARAERIDVLHAQNKHMLVPGAIARALTGLPLLLTIRDTSLIDPAPVCLHHHDRRPADCGVSKLWRECSVAYFDEYMRGRRSRLATRVMFLYGWLEATYIRQRVLRGVDAVVGVSDGILGIYRRSGLLDGARRVETIYTIPPLGEPPRRPRAPPFARATGWPARSCSSSGSSRRGKGTNDFLAAGEEVHRAHPDALFVLVGDGQVAVPAAPWIRRLAGSTIATCSRSTRAPTSSWSPR